MDVDKINRVCTVVAGIFVLVLGVYIMVEMFSFITMLMSLFILFFGACIILLDGCGKEIVTNQFVFLGNYAGRGVYIFFLGVLTCHSDDAFLMVVPIALMVFGVLNLLLFFFHKKMPESASLFTAGDAGASATDSTALNA
eukprot:240141_1